MDYERLRFHGVHRLVLLLLVNALVLNLPFVSRGRILEPEMNNYDVAPPKGTLKSIKGEDGEIVDCVDIWKQPAFDHPLLKDHKIQMRPSPSPMNQSNPKPIHQPWHKNGYCSEGSVPIRRRQLQDQPPTTQPNEKIKGPHHEFAGVQAIPTTGTRFYGGSAIISTWDPFVARQNDSSASTFLVRLSSQVFLEAGWIVFPRKYGDDRPRLFMYYTTDNSLTSRCWDLDCNVFVQVNNKFSLGGHIARVSTIGGALYEFKITIFQDQKTGNWWLSIMDTPIGYWPASLLPGLPEAAMSLRWGGSVYDSVGNGPHTKTNMGNGLFPDLGTYKASYLCSLQYVDESFKLRIPERSSLTAGGTNPLCYNAQLLPELDTKKGMCFLFGGPGKNPKCP